MFADAIESILRDHCTPAAVRAVEAGAGAGTLSTLFNEAGFHDLLVSEELGGGGASWSEFHAVVKLFGFYALGLPLGQSMAARLLVSSPDRLPPGLITFAPAVVRGQDGSLVAPLVPAGRIAAHCIAAVSDTLVLLPASQVDRTPTGVHGSLTASLRWRPDAGTVLEGDVPAEHLLPIGALLHAGLLSGAMKRAFDLTMRYANERVQFGKPIGRFQAIQHQLGVMAEHVAAAGMAVEAAFDSGAGLPSLNACALAKARASEAAQLVAGIAHAVHGAIGITEEYDLQLYTRRLHEWRMAHGSETHWNRLIGAMFVESGEPLAADFVRTMC